MTRIEDGENGVKPKSPKMVYHSVTNFKHLPSSCFYSQATSDIGCGRSNTAGSGGYVRKLMENMKKTGKANESTDNNSFLFQRVAMDKTNSYANLGSMSSGLQRVTSRKLTVRDLKYK